MKRYKIFVFGFLLIGFALRLYKLGTFELWVDEAVSYYIASFSSPEKILIYSASSLYEHPPLFYILLHFWIKWVGKSEWLLRFPSVLCGVLSIALAWPLIKRLGDEKVVGLTVILTTFYPPLIALSQDVRMYAFIIALSLVINWLLLAFSEGNRWAGAALYIIVAILGFFVHYFFLWILIVHLLWVIYLNRKGYNVSYKIVAIAISFFPLLSVIALPNLTGTLIRELKTPALATPLMERIRIVALELTIVGEPKLRLESLPQWAIIAVCSTWILALYGGFIALKSASINQTLSFFWLVIPVLGLIPLYGMVRGRHLAFVLPALLILVSLALSKLIQRQKLSGIIFGTLIFLNLAYGLRSVYTFPKGAFGQAARFIIDNSYPGDAVVLSFPLADVLAHYYLNSENLTIYKLPEKLSFIPREWEFPSEEQIEAKLRDIFSKHPRLWLGPYTPAALDPEGKIEQWLNKNAFPVMKVWFPQSTFIALYLPPWLFPEEDINQLPIRAGQFQIFLPVILKHSTFQREKPKSISFGYNFEDLLVLRKAHIDKSPFKSGQGIRLEFQWEVLKRLETEVLVVLSIKDREGNLVAKRVSPLQGGSHPYVLYCPGELIKDHHGLLIPPGTLPGRYELWLSLYLPDYDRNVSVQGKTEIKLTEFQIEPGLFPHPAVKFGIYFPKITLIGADRWPEELLQGQFLILTLYWVPNTDEEFSLRVHLCNHRGEVLTQSEELLRPAEAGMNVPVRSIFSLLIPGRLKPGEYLIQGQIRSRRTGESFEWILGKVKIYPISRSFRKPSDIISFEATVENVAKLIGYKLNTLQIEPGRSLLLTLVWQAISEPQVNYTVFTHLVGQDGKIWGQKDNPPTRGLRPTSTWIKGEYITDEYLILVHPNASEGIYTLYAGFYNPQTMERLPAFDAKGERFPNDAIPIAKIEVTRK